MSEAYPASSSRKCNFTKSDNGMSVNLCHDMSNQLSPDNVGNTFKFVYVSGSPAIVCYDGSILRYCPFCGERIGEDQIPTNRFINADWREFK